MKTQAYQFLKTDLYRWKHGIQEMECDENKYNQFLIKIDSKWNQMTILKHKDLWNTSIKNL